MNGPQKLPKGNEEKHTKRLSMCKKLQNVKTFEKVVEKKEMSKIHYEVMRFGEWILLLHVQVTNAIHDVRVNLPFKHSINLILSNIASSLNGISEGKSNSIVEVRSFRLLK